MTQSKLWTGRGSAWGRWRTTAGVIVAVVACVSVLPRGTAAQADALRVVASNGVKAPLEALRPQAERAIGRPIAMEFGTTAALRQQLAGSSPFDLAVLTVEAVDDLAKAGTLVAATRAPLGRSGIGVGVRAGASVPDIGTSAALKRTLLAARSLTYASDGASRQAIERMFGALGIADAVREKTRLEQGSIRATARVVDGDVDLVMTLVSEIMPIPGLQLAGALPNEFQGHVSFAAAVGAHAAHAEAARALVAFLTSGEALKIFKAKGIERP